MALLCDQFLSNVIRSHYTDYPYVTSDNFMLVHNRYTGDAQTAAHHGASHCYHGHDGTAGETRIKSINFFFISSDSINTSIAADPWSERCLKIVPIDGGYRQIEGPLRCR